MLLSSCLPLAIFIRTDLVHVVLLQNSCQHPRNHCHPDSPHYFLHPESHPKGNLCSGAGLSSPPLPFSGTCTATEPTSLLDLGCKDTLLPFCIGARLPVFDERPATSGCLAGCPCIGALVQLHQHELLRHPPPSPAPMPAEAGPISLVFWMGKNTVYSHRAPAGRQQTKSMNRCGLSLDAKYSPWGMDFRTCGVLTCWLPSLQLTPRAAARMYGGAWDNMWPHTRAPAWLSGSWGSIIRHKHMPEQPGLTPSLLARQHGTFALLLFPQVPPNILRKRFPLPASCVLHEPAKLGCLGSESTTMGKAGGEASCLVLQRGRELARRTSSREQGRVPQIAPGLHCLHLGRHSAGIGLRSRRGNSDAGASGKALLGQKQVWWATSWLASCCLHGGAGLSSS